ncbi:hypothetical protein LOC68_18335 [Blastopirellula sp. JC732]|uniref:Uncharacterized protein n=1 Tax=Blastopirellula sediminis TaxID=2894196 RepID=A0A9X1SHF9_9BACT|nr:hypothetical protein [Blastopirellula sediminis]MCC9606344.1 hypothetical protein [Blastopirellula sediminis]MCC9630358.1 hypothetical protein [Blastopirellula sediminis]
MNARGTWLVAAILLLAVSVAVLTTIYHWNRARAAIGYFGPEEAALIRSAQQVFLVRKVDGKTERRDISHVADLDDLKKALVEDASYQIPGKPNRCTPTWTTMLEFHEHGRSYEIEIDVDCGYIRAAGAQSQLDAEPIREGLQQFVAFAISRTTPITETNRSE